MAEETQVVDSGKVETQVSEPSGETKEQISTETTQEQNIETKPEQAKETVASADIDKKLRQFQADRDRAESQLKTLYKQVMQHFDVDETGTVTGLKKTEVPVQEQVSRLDQLAEAALMTGDKEAFKQVIEMTKNEIKNEVRNESLKDFESRSAVKEELSGLAKDYPNLWTKDSYGRDIPNESDPLYQEAARILEKYPEMAHPLKVRAAIEAAEGRIIKKNLPRIEQDMKNQAHTKIRQIGAGITGTGISAPEGSDDLENVLTTEQKDALSREGYSPDGMKRVAKIVKQAQKEGGFILS